MPHPIIFFRYFVCNNATHRHSTRASAEQRLIGEVTSYDL